MTTPRLTARENARLAELIWTEIICKRDTRMMGWNHPWLSEGDKRRFRKKVADMVDRSLNKGK